MSSMRSASSSTQMRTRSSRSSLRVTRSISRPGVATRMSARRALAPAGRCRRRRRRLRSGGVSRRRSRGTPRSPGWRARASAPGSAPTGCGPLGRQQLDERRCERERLARSGPRAREDVTSGEGVGDHEGLISKGRSVPRIRRARVTGSETPSSMNVGEVVLPSPCGSVIARCTSFLRFLWIGGARARREPGGRPRRERRGTPNETCEDRETSSRRVSGRDPQDVSLDSVPDMEGRRARCSTGSGRSRFQCFASPSTAIARARREQETRVIARAERPRHRCTAAPPRTCAADRTASTSGAYSGSLRSRDRRLPEADVAPGT